MVFPITKCNCCNLVSCLSNRKLDIDMEKLQNNVKIYHNNVEIQYIDSLITKIINLKNDIEILATKGERSLCVFEEIDIIKMAWISDDYFKTIQAILPKGMTLVYKLFDVEENIIDNCRIESAYRMKLYLYW